MAVIVTRHHVPDATEKSLYISFHEKRTPEYHSSRKVPNMTTTNSWVLSPYKRMRKVDDDKPHCSFDDQPAVSTLKFTHSQPTCVFLLLNFWPSSSLLASFLVLPCVSFRSHFGLYVWYLHVVFVIIGAQFSLLDEPQCDATYTVQHNDNCDSIAKANRCNCILFFCMCDQIIIAAKMATSLAT